MKRNGGSTGRRPSLALITRALNQAVRDAVELHRESGIPLAVWKDGKVALVAADEVESKRKVAKSRSGKSRREPHNRAPNPVRTRYNGGMKRQNGRLLERLLNPVSASLNEEAARKLIGLKADPKVNSRVKKLARKCNEGKLTAEEQAEYETYVLAGDFIALLQAKARVILSRRGQPA
jgi:hypothetical protein